MSKVKLSKAELAALDALIAALEDGESVNSSGSENLTFITAVARVTAKAINVAAKATPVVQVATAFVGAANKDTSNFEGFIDSNGEFSLDALIKLREAANQ